jgi:hypothetical protein
MAPTASLRVILIPRRELIQLAWDFNLSSVKLFLQK